MSNTILQYKKSIDTKVKIAIEKTFKTKVLDVLKMKNGEYNHVYKVVTIDNSLLVRVFRNKYWPEDGKLEWIEKQLTKQRIPHAKILYYSRKSDYFLNGFMVTEFLEGLNGWSAVRQNQISIEQSFVEIGKAANRIHKIQIKKFGLVNKGKGTEANFIKKEINSMREHLEKLTKQKQFDQSFQENLFSKIESSLIDLLPKLKPVLVHADPSRENAIYTPDGRWILIDWDNALSSIWLEDFADLTFWCDYKRRKKEAIKREALIAKNFFKGYGKTVLTPTQIQKITKVLHIIKCVKMLPYYYFIQKNLKDYKWVKNKLYRLLGHSY
jgi:Ser/Thr protein kinase RdoA (MazF antagonist)